MPTSEMNDCNRIPITGWRNGSFGWRTGDRAGILPGRLGVMSRWNDASRWPDGCGRLVSCRADVHYPDSKGFFTVDEHKARPESQEGSPAGVKLCDPTNPNRCL